MGIIIAILLFSFIIIFHELGHFLLARINGIRVDEFSLGLGPTLIGKKFGDTFFCIKLLPFGGACMMGEDDVEDVSEGSFNSKSVWARMSVIAAGPIFNLILAWIFCTIFIMSVGYRTTELTGVMDGSSAQEAGLQSGDVITEINGRNVHLWDDIEMYLTMHPDVSEYNVTFERDGKEYTEELELRILEGESVPRLGVQAAGLKESGLFDGIRYGLYKVKYWINYTGDSIRMLISGSAGIKDLSGPVGIVNIVGQVYETAAPAGLFTIVISMLNFAALLTTNLGILNLLPLPALDGGRLVFLIIEAIRRKRVSPEKEGMVHFAGFALLMILMVVVMYNDIMKLF